MDNQKITNWQGKRGICSKCSAPPPETKGIGAYVVQWVIRLNPPEHPAWDSYLLSIVSLAHVEGLPDPHKDFPEAEYELSLFALSSESRIDPRDMRGALILYPANLTVQFGGCTHEHCQELASLLAKALADGFLPAEAGDYGERGLEVWRGSLLQTLEHLVTGHHSSPDAIIINPGAPERVYRPTSTA